MDGASAQHNLLVFLLLTAAVAAELDATTVPACAPPFVVVKGHCLFFYHLSQTSWDIAQEECALFGASLAKIVSGNMMEGIAAYIDDNDKDWNTNGFWVGATDASGDWLWQDGKAVKMGTPFWGYMGNNPAQQEPGSGPNPPYCAVMPKSYFYYLHDYPCSDPDYSPLCELP